jgi:LacI family transcriptional regulator
MVTLHDVARRAGVSITTVSHTLNGTRFVQPETARRVLDAVRELGYSPNAVARGLRTGASRTIGVIGPSAGDPFFAEVVRGIEETCFDRGYDVYLGFVEYPHGAGGGEPVADIRREEEFLRAVFSGRYDTPSPEMEEIMEGMDKEEALIEKLLSREVDGLILNPGQRDSVVAKSLLGVRPRLALFHRTIPGVSADVFVSDDYAGFSQALEDLVGMGHRRIGMVYGYSWESHAVRERFRAFHDAMARAGIELDIALLQNGGYSLEGSAGATRRLLALAHPPTAILYWSDLMAIAGMDAARGVGVRVPDGLSVVGFDDLPISSLVFPRLSSVRQEKFEMGAAMTRRVIDRIEGKLQGACLRTVLPTTYIRRESVSTRS